MLSFLDNPKNFGKKKQKGLGAWTKVMGPHTCSLIFFAQARIIYYLPFYFLKIKQAMCHLLVLVSAIEEIARKMSWNFLNLKSFFQFIFI